MNHSMGEDHNPGSGRAGSADGSPRTDHGDDAGELVALSSALRRAADGLDLATVPVEAVVRRGRARRLRRRATASGAVLAVVAASLTLTLWPPGPPSTAPPATAASDDAPNDARSSTPSARPATRGGIRVLKPYEAESLGGGWRLALLPEGRQNYLLTKTDEEEFQSQLEQQRHLAGSSLRPGGVSSASDGERVHGAWRHPDVARITVAQKNEVHPATLYSLPGEPGWGVYHVEADGLNGSERYTVTAYDSAGEVLATNEHTRWWTDEPGEGAQSDDDR